MDAAVNSLRIVLAAEESIEKEQAIHLELIAKRYLVVEVVEHVTDRSRYPDGWPISHTR